MTSIKDMAGVKCEICGTVEHVLELHILKAHALTVPEYHAQHPGAPVLSPLAKARLAEMEKASKNQRADFNIKKAFGVEINKNIQTVDGWEKPNPTTPKVDADYVFKRETLAVALFALFNTDERVLLSGPTGSGKSSIVEQVVARLNKPFTRINCDSDMTRADFVGQWILEGEETRFQYGLLPKAMREGHVLLVDEWDVANPSVAMALQAVLEPGGKLTITETGEVIEAHPDFRIFATSNTLGMGDDSGLYNGTQPQNYAQLDRFTMVEIVDYPDRTTEKRVLRSKTGIADEDVLGKLLDVAKLTREAFKKGEIMATFSTRTIINVAKKLLAFGDVKRAYDLAIINKLGADDRLFVQEIIQRVWGI